MTSLQIKRSALGFLEHTETLSLARYPENVPQLDWEALEQLWSDKKDKTGRTPILIPDLWGKFYICHDQAGLHEDEPEEGKIRLGMIIHRQAELMVNGSGRQIEITCGDVFLTENHFQHKAKTKGTFVFAVKDLRLCDLPNVEKARRHFLRDIEKIRRYLNSVA